MTRRDRAKRFSIKYRANDPHEPGWVVRVARLPGGVKFFVFPPVFSPGIRDFDTLPEALDYARSQQPAPTEVPC